jgi:hypothetical protein
VLCLLGLLIVLLGRDDYFGYLNKYFYLTLAVSLSVSLYRISILGAYAYYLNDELDKWGGN